MIITLNINEMYKAYKKACSGIRFEDYIENEKEHIREILKEEKCVGETENIDFII